MNVIQIENDDVSFLEWLLVNHNGYVLNLRKSGNERQVAMHTAWCKKVIQRKKTDRISPFTGQKYMKVVSHSVKDLTCWANSKGVSQHDIKFCSSCSPLQPIIDYVPHDFDLVDKHFEHELKAVNLITEEELDARLTQLTLESKTNYFTAKQIERNPYVVRRVLDLAKGICNRCQKLGPFIRKTDGTRFLEVHHIKPLSEKGDDLVSNCEALCPNCHREAHFGV